MALARFRGQPPRERSGGEQGQFVHQTLAQQPADQGRAAGHADVLAGLPLRHAGTRRRPPGLRATELSAHERDVLGIRQRVPGLDEAARVLAHQVAELLGAIGRRFIVAP